MSGSQVVKEVAVYGKVRVDEARASLRMKTVFHHYARDFRLKWHSLALFLHLVRTNWVEKNKAKFGNLRRLARSEEILLDITQISGRTILQIDMIVSSCQGSILEFYYEIFTVEEKKLTKIGIAVVHMILLKKVDGKLKSSEATEELKAVATNISLPQEYRIKSAIFTAQKISKKTKPFWVYPILIRISDEDTNRHVHHGTYFHYFSDVKLFAVKSGLSEKPVSSVGITLEIPPPEIIELATYEVSAFFISFHREARMTDNLDFYIIVQADLSNRALEYFLCAEDPQTKAEMLFTTARMEFSDETIDTSLL